MRRLLPVLLVLAPLLLAPASQADVSLVRVLVGERTFADGEFTFRDHLVVPPGSTLTFRNARVWLDADRACTEDLADPTVCLPQLAVYGALVLENATLDTRNWAGNVESGFILNVERGTARITGSTLRHYSGITFYQPGPSPSLVEGNEFREGAEPIRFMQGVEAAFRRNLVVDAREGVEVSDASVPVEDNVFRNVTQKLGVGALNWAISVLASSPNDYAWPAEAPIRRNLVENATAGIVSRTGTAHVIEDNVVRGVQAGLMLVMVQDGQVKDRTAPIVRRNLVEEARFGIRVSGQAATSAVPSPLTNVTLSLTDNALADIRCIGVQVLPIPNAIRVSVDATGLWWGSGRGPQDAGPGCPAVLVQDESATLDVTPWLRAPPAWVVPHVPDVRTS